METASGPDFAQMPSWQDFTLSRVQTTVFTPEHSEFASSKAVRIVLQEFQERFDGEMQVLPLPSEVPAEIHRVVLQSSDRRWRLSMAPARIDSVWQSARDGNGANLRELCQQCVDVQMEYVRGAGVSVGRVALVVYRYCPIDNPAQALIERFCNEASQREPFNRSQSFEIHNHKVYSLEGEGIDYQVNSWVRCKSARLMPDDYPVIRVEQDLNTLATEMESRRFDPAQMDDFFRMAAVEANEILQKYFP
jgi:hypothetical protein